MSLKDRIPILWRFSFPQPEGWIESMTPPFSKAEDENIIKEPSNQTPGITRTHIPVPSWRCKYCEVDWHTTEECPKRPH